MRAEDTKLAPRPVLPGAAQSTSWVAAAGAAAAWTALVVMTRIDASRFSLGGTKGSAIVYGVPAVLAAILVFDARAAASRPLRLVTAWCVMVVLAVVAADHLSKTNTGLAAVPALAVASVVFARRPAAAVALALVMSGFYGSLIAFWSFPEEKTVQLVLGGLALGLMWKAFIGGRAYAQRVTLGLALPLLYVYVTLVQTILDTGNPAAWRGFMSSSWFMVGFGVIALAGWPSAVYERIAKGVVVVAALVGAYGVYRWIAGISTQEYFRWGLDTYNYVGGKLRLLGSFPTGQDLGGWTALVVPFCLAAALTFGGRWRIACLAAAGACTVALAGSQLRIAVVAVALGALTVVVLHEASRGFAGRRLGATATAVLAMVALGATAFQITGGTTDKVTHSYTSLLHPFNRSDPSVDARLYKWDAALRDLRAHPFGYGIGTANKQATNRLTDYESVGQFDVDNGFLRVALEQGFAIMILFALAVLLLTAELGRKAVRVDERVPAGILIGAAGTLVSFCVLEWAVAFQDGPRALPVWIIAGMGVAQYTAVRSRPAEPAAGPNT
jgi:hypothetical protein